MPKLTDQRRQAIYSAVHDELMDLRIELSRLDTAGRLPRGNALDDILHRYQLRSAEAAVRAASANLRGWKIGQRIP